MTIAQIKYFLSVLEHGSFSEAAEEMYISQSSFSKQIKNLETELGVALFLRSNAKVSLTPAGEIFEPHARLMDSTYNQLMGDMTSYKNSSAENTVTVAALPLLYEYGISDALCTFHESRDSVQVNVVETNQPDILTGLLSGRFDFAVLNDDGSLDFLIEANGKQHYSPVGKFGGRSGLSRQQYNDCCKKRYCKKHGIKLVSISYKDEDKLSYDYIMASAGYT